MMIDELDLSFDDNHDRGRSRHRRGARSAAARDGGPPPGKRRGRSLIALSLAVVLLAVLGAGGWYGVNKVRDYFAVKDYKTAGTGKVTVQVVSGDTATDIANRLFTQGVVKSGKAYVDAVADNPNGNGVQPGFYTVRSHMKAALALDMLLAKDTKGNLINKVSTKVTITEGEISPDIYLALSKATKVPVAQFQAAAKDPAGLGVPSWWFTRGDGKPVNKANIEGFLYPATYEFDPGATAKQILSAIVNNFNTEIGDLKFDTQVQHNLNLSPYEALVAASIAQVEAIRPQDMKNVARVMYNRAYTGTFPCSCMQIDSEVNYWLRISGKTAQDSGNLTQSQLHDPTDPYNTHDKPGLPIGPISNPGKDALTAAMAPPKNGYLYFLAVNKKGDTAFATTQAQFDALIQQACRNGINIC